MLRLTALHRQGLKRQRAPTLRVANHDGKLNARPSMLGYKRTLGARRIHCGQHQTRHDDMARVKPFSKKVQFFSIF